MFYYTQTARLTWSIVLDSFFKPECRSLGVSYRIIWGVSDTDVCFSHLVVCSIFVFANVSAPLISTCAIYPQCSCKKPRSLCPKHPGPDSFLLFLSGLIGLKVVGTGSMVIILITQGLFLPLGCLLQSTNLIQSSCNFASRLSTGTRFRAL